MKYLLLIIFLVQGCGIATTRPKFEMSIAAAAYRAATTAKAPELAPNLFRQAESFYLKAKSAYRRKYFNKAKEYAIKSKILAEKAEFQAVKKAALEGTSDPFN